MAQHTDHGGLYYAELIKSNLQFIYGKECLLEILSQVRAPDTWQVSILKTENGFRSVAFVDSGTGLLDVLQKLHRKSAEMLSTFIADHAAEATAYVKRKRAENKATTAAGAAAAGAGATACVAAKTDNAADSKAAERSPEADAPNEGNLLSLANAGSDSENLSDDAYVWLRDVEGGPARRLIVKGCYGKHLPHEIAASLRAEGGRFRGILCPNYGPVRSFPRRSLYDPTASDLSYVVDCKPNSQAADAAVPSKAEPAPDAGGKPQPDKAAAQPELRLEAMSPAVRMQYDQQMRHRHRNPTPPARISVLLYIQWSGYGETVVADECHLSVRALQSRVRHMLRTHGPGLFGDAHAHIITSVMFTPEELVNFVVTVKGMRVNGSMMVLGPGFGDDLSAMVSGQKLTQAVKIEIDLKWNGKLFNNNNNSSSSSSSSSSNDGNSDASNAAAAN
ncbi:hypothetical protein Trco_007676 [Trichoderma cornu-damae]|uniref:Uncharacterized protein n=1 Tax=Trichoderma cornu-damae TaxID=654480 RepID=A0A9P8QJM3_9HYPO|nr:hypothetical protein Trco_007676 [Trichoderma cornu-damae]